MASDGWLGERQVMERGSHPAFSRDGRRLRWLEHTADIDGIGELRSVGVSEDGVPGDAPLRLALNVVQYEELDDGRVLVADDHATTGPHNRVIVIDEAARTARWVSPAAAGGFIVIPGSGDVLVRQPRDDGGEDLVRVPIPPRAGASPPGG
jgi:hypothetical protein